MDVTPWRALKPTHQGQHRIGAESDVYDCCVGCFTSLHSAFLHNSVRRRLLVLYFSSPRGSTESALLEARTAAAPVARQFHADLVVLGMLHDRLGMC